jgi:hypothetical protein
MGRPSLSRRRASDSGLGLLRPLAGRVGLPESWRRSGAPWPYLPADAQCRPDAWGRSSIFALHFKFSRWVNDANHPLGSRVHVHMPHFYRLLVPSAVSVQGLHQIEL